MTRDDIKEAMREVMDETLVTYSNGSAAFAENVTLAFARMVDAFDDYFTRNLLTDRPQVAQAYIDARLHSARETQKLLESKIQTLQTMRATSLKAERLRTTKKSVTKRRNAR